MLYAMTSLSRTVKNNVLELFAGCLETVRSNMSQSMFSHNTSYDKTSLHWPEPFTPGCFSTKNEPQHDKTNQMTCVPSKDSDQRFMGSKGHKLTSVGQWTL